jgi:phytol kinase
MMNAWLAMAVTMALALLWLRINDFFAHKGWISRQTSRKIIHTGTGPIFVLCWLLFPDEPISRYLAAGIPFLISIQFLLVGLGWMKDQASIDALTRRGDRREILRGPLIYGMAFVTLTIFFWTDSPTGVVALMMLSGGDGLADIVGKRFGTVSLPWSKSKTWAGSFAMFLGGITFSIGVIFFFLQARVWFSPLESYIFPTLIIGLICTAVESLPIEEYDNITVPVIALIIGQLILPKG